ncbi:MAG: T9SS type A sorting domain-containing protein, partial [Saprospiraceae bacterium]
VIHSPDSLGLACDFRQHDLVLPARNTWIMPNFPHFRLYDLPGSPCDTLGINGPVAAGEPAGVERARLAVWPNPAQASCTVQVIGEEGFSGRWALYSSAGQEVLSGVWPAGQGSQEIGLEGVAAGMYYFVLRTAGGRVLAERVAVW